MENSSQYFLERIQPLIDAETTLPIINYLKENKLIKNKLICSTNDCNRVMIFRTFLSCRDSSEWLCTYCPNIKTITVGSFFDDISLNLKKWMRAMYLWGTEESFENTAEQLGITEVNASQAYEAIRKICVYHIKHNKPKLGGNGLVVVIDYDVSSSLLNEVLQKIPLYIGCVFDISTNKGYLEVTSDKEETTNKIKENVIELGSEVHYSDEEGYRDIIELYWDKRIYLRNLVQSCVTKNSVNSYISQKMWLDRYQERAFLTLCDHIRDAYIVEDYFEKVESYLARKFYIKNNKNIAKFVDNFFPLDNFKDLSELLIKITLEN